MYANIVKIPLTIESGSFDKYLKGIMILIIVNVDFYHIFVVSQVLTYVLYKY